MRYLTRQVAVDAILWDGKEDTFGQIRDMVGDEYELFILDEDSNLIQMDTEMGVAYPEPGEWIVWDGEFAQAYKDARFWEMHRRADGPEIEIREIGKVEAVFMDQPMHPTHMIELTATKDIPAGGVGEARIDIKTIAGEEA